MNSLSEQSRVASGAAVPVRREGSKPLSNKENMHKNLLLHSTETRSYNDLANSSFSALLTSDEFDVKKDYLIQPQNLTAFLLTEGMLCVPLQ